MAAAGEPISLEQFFAGKPAESRELFDAVAREIDGLGGAEIKPTKSQVAFWRRHPFAWTWMSSQYLGERPDFAPLVLTIALHERDDSPRWKQVVEPRPGTYVHHLELRDTSQVDDDVRAWLRRAWEQAG